jgi:hypothetical protein
MPARHKPIKIPLDSNHGIFSVTNMLWLVRGLPFGLPVAVMMIAAPAAVASLRIRGEGGQ